MMNVKLKNRLRKIYTMGEYTKKLEMDLNPEILEFIDTDSRRRKNVS